MKNIFAVIGVLFIVLTGIALLDPGVRYFFKILPYLIECEYSDKHTECD